MHIVTYYDYLSTSYHDIKRHLSSRVWTVYTSMPEYSDRVKIPQGSVFIDGTQKVSSEHVSLYSANRKKSGDCSWNPIMDRQFGLDHGVGHPLLLLYDVKAPNDKNSNEFKGLYHYLPMSL